MASAPAPTWLGEARYRNQNLGVVSYDGGTLSPVSKTLRRTGYLERVRMDELLKGIFSVAPTGTDAYGSLGSLLNRVTLRANSIGILFDCSGAMLKVISAIDTAYNKGTSNLANAANLFITTPGTTAFTDEWFSHIPVSLNLINYPTPVGLFQLALNSQETDLILAFNPTQGVANKPATGVYQGGTLTNTNGSQVQFQQVFFDPIAAASAQPSLAYVHQWRQFRVGISNDGDAEVPLPPPNYYCRVVYNLVTNGAPDSTHLTNLKLMYGGNYAPHDETVQQVQSRMSDDYGFTMPAGFYTHDFLAETHTDRDIIDSSQATDLRAILTVTGATYTNASYIDVAVEQLIPLVLPSSTAQAPV